MSKLILGHGKNCYFNRNVLSKCLRILFRNGSSSSGSGNYEVCTISDCMVDPCSPEPSIVIIGAGIAGMSTAHRLIQCGLSKITILEATDRVGGRIHSCWFEEVMAEMGAHAIEGGCIANPVYNLACQEGLLKTPVQRTDGFAGLFCTSDGRAVDPPIALSAYHIFQQIEREAHSLFALNCGKIHGSLAKFFEIRTQQELKKFPEDQRYEACRVMYGLANRIRTRIGEDLNIVSADNYGSKIRNPGGIVQVTGGFNSIFVPLVADLPMCAIQYSKPVNNIRWGSVTNTGARALIHCCDGEEYKADYVVITCPLGVLKQHADKLFCPTLPKEKSDAIRNIGYGYVDKIFLQYTRPFWVVREGGIKLSWSPDELCDRTDWTKGISEIAEVEGSQNVLVAYIAGPEALEMERVSDEEVASGITRILRQFTGDASLPYPSTILRSKWGSDPYFCGSYSYLGMDASVGDQCDLASPLPGPCEPIAPILLFAGEATAIGHFGTVHGARLSGIREAERIIQLTKKFKGPPPTK